MNAPSGRIVRFELATLRHRAALQDRLRPRPNAALGENTDRSPYREAGKCLTNGAPFRAIAPHREGTESAHQRCAPSSAEQLLHRHPVDITRIPGTDQWRIEMADVIAGQDAAAGWDQLTETDTMYLAGGKNSTRTRYRQTWLKIRCGICRFTWRAR